MQCIRPINAGYSHEPSKSGVGYGITFSAKNVNKELVGFSVPCRKCLPCRLNQAREKAVRCYHESKMHDENIFLTLTYNEKNLKSSRLLYEDWQLFAKRLRRSQDQKIPLMVTGEYGELYKRPHWHALIFNYRPSDQKFKYTSDRGDKVYTSENLSSIWGKGNIEYGEVTMDSANYVARYAAKKLVHGNDQDHDFHPLHRTSSKYGIGRSWIEKNYRHALTNGFVLLPNGSKSKLPRYYVDWAKKYQPELWLYYVTEVQPKIVKLAEVQAEYEFNEYWDNPSRDRVQRKYIKEHILKSKFKTLQEKLKL